MSKRQNSTLEAVADQLRSIALATDEGAFLGNEEALLARTNVSRGTLVQAARLLEREGLLRVRRGGNGGYFSARPSADVVEHAMNAFLATVNMDTEDSARLSSALWVEAVRKAATLGTPEAQAFAKKHQNKIKKLPIDASFAEIGRLEIECQTDLFKLIDSKYIELMCQVNMNYARRYFGALVQHRPSTGDHTEAHRKFATMWRDAKHFELAAIANADPDLAVSAARHARELTHNRIWVMINLIKAAEAPAGSKAAE